VGWDDKDDYDNISGRFLMKKIITVLLTILMLFSVFQGALRENAVTADSQPIWPMFHYNAQNTGQCPYSTLNNGGGLKWKFNMGSSGLAIGSDGIIYIGSNFFYALNPDGTLKWIYQGDIPYGFGASAIGHDGTIYTETNRFFYALNPDGTLKWKYQIDGLMPYPVVASDGTIYFQTMPGSSVVDAYLYAFNPDGTLKWKYRTGSCGSSKVAPIIGQDGTIYVGGVELNESLYPIYYLYAINPDGTLKWKYAVDGEIWVPVATSSDGTIYAQTWTYGRPRNYLYAINTDGTLKWKNDFEGVGTSSCPAISYDGTVYLGGYGHLYAISPDGKEKWEYKGDFPGGFCSPVISSEGTIYSAQYDFNILYAFNPDGTLKWKYEKDSWGGNDTSLAIGSDGTIYYTCGDIRALNSPAPKSFGILASAGSGGSIFPSGVVTVNQGDNPSFTITSDVGYHIADVKIDGVSVGAVSTYTFTNVISNHTIESIFEANLPTTYTIVASAGSGGAIYPYGTITVNPGDSKTFTILPNVGYHIKEVKIDGNSVGVVTSFTFQSVNSSHTIEALFESNATATTYTIQASMTTGGYISPSGTITVNYGESKTFSIHVYQGYHLKDVKVDGASVGAVLTYTFTNITSNHTIDMVFEKYATVISLQIGNNFIGVNGGDSSQMLDSPPIIKNDRTLVPIRAIIEALGGTVGWDANEKKVTISLGSNTIELWIGKSIAKVNGIDTPIDSANLKVVPEIINGRTMLPIRFITENLGCDVQWDGPTQTITITYGG
jgi:outer membrane protein assembly factor BamB